MPGVFFRTPLGIVSLIQQSVPGFTRSQLIGIFADQLSDEGGLCESAGTVTANGLVWQTFEVVANGQALVSAFAEAQGGTRFVMVSGLPSQRDDLRKHVLLPVVGALTTIR